ncbi:MAG: porin [Phycisphaerales bacterium]|nr:porin [Phycisphaerales bacterium]
MSFATKAGIIVGAAAFSGMAVAGTGDATNDLQSRLEAAEAKIAEMSAQQNGDWLTEQRSEQIRGIVQDVLADADTRASLQGNGATSGYNDGFFVQSADGKWSMKINGLFQERFNVGHQPNDVWASGGGPFPPADKDTAFGFETTRAALNFSGTLAGVAYYDARLDWSPYNGNNGLSSSPLQWAYGGWHCDENWSVQLGRQKMQVTRGFIVNAEDQQAIERSSYDYFWASSQITNGIMAKGSWDQFRMNVMFSNGFDTNAGTNGNLNTWQNNVQGWAITGRGEWLLEGAWDQFDHIGSAAGSADAWLLGFGAGYLKGNTAAAAGAVNDDEPDAWLVTADLSYESDGWNLYGSGSYQRTNTGIAGADDVNSVGFEAGAGMYMDDNNELYGRWQWVNPGLGAGAVSSNINIATIGWNHYIAGPNTKLSADWSWCFSDPSMANAMGGGGWGYTGWWNNTGGAIPGGQTSGSLWLLRTQLQVSF